MNTVSEGEVLRITGFESLSVGTASLFRELVQAALQPAHRCLEVDLARATFVDSEGLGALVAVHRRMKEQSGKVVLIGASAMVHDLLQLTGIDEMFEFRAV